MLVRHRHFCVFFMLAGTGSALAADPSGEIDETLLFEDIPSVYSASKFEQPITKAPASVSVVTADEIKKFGYRNLADILGSLRGMYTSYDRAYHRVGIRGFNRPGDYNYRLLVLIDGHRANDNLVDYNAVGTEFLIDADDISRVELVRGPTSSLYGSNAFFGTVNIITKQGRDIKGAAVTGAAGNQNTYKGKFTYGDKWANGSELYLSGTHYQSDGNSRLPVEGFGNAVDMDKDTSQRGFAKWTFEDFTLSGGYVSRDKRIPLPTSGKLFNDPRNDFVDDRAYADLTYQHGFDNGLDVMARTYYDFTDFDGSYAFAPTGLYKDRFKGQWWGSELQLSKRWAEHLLTLGGEYRHNFQQIMHSYEQQPYQQYADGHFSTSIWGIYLQDEYRLFDNLTLNAGFRYDQYETVGGTFNPRVALIYQPFDDTTVKLLYGQAFRAPSVFEQNYTFTDTWIGNPALKPETIHSYELNVSQRLNQHLELSFAPYYNEVADVIDLAGTGTIADPRQYKNMSNMDTLGFETELTGRWENGWRAGLSYSYQKSELTDQGGKLENSPVHLTKLNMTAPLWQDKVFASFNFNYTGERHTYRSRLPGYFLLNASLFTHDLVKGLELSGTLYNLSDIQYSDPIRQDSRIETVEQNGRLFLLKFNYEF